VKDGENENENELQKSRPIRGKNKHFERFEIIMHFGLLDHNRAVHRFWFTRGKSFSSCVLVLGFLNSFLVFLEPKNPRTQGK